MNPQKQIESKEEVQDFNAQEAQFFSERQKAFSKSLGRNAPMTDGESARMFPDRVISPNPFN